MSSVQLEGRRSGARSHWMRRSGLSLLACLSACHAWQPRTLGPTPDLGATRVKVERTDGSTVSLLEARIVGDSIVGVWAGSSSRVAVAIADARRIQAYQLNGDRTILAVLGIGAGVWFVAYQVTREREPTPYDICPGPTGCFGPRMSTP